MKITNPNRPIPYSQSISPPKGGEYWEYGKGLGETIIRQTHKPTPSLLQNPPPPM
jgi:hypothetical protein